MSENENHIPLPANDSGNARNGAESFRTVPNDSATFGNVPKASESFGTVRNDAESFRSVPKASERKENHSLTVREAVRMFEGAGVARTERSITNWCQPNRTGIARLDSYFDPNERKYYITPQSVELAIAEEKAKAAKLNQPTETPAAGVNASEPFRTVPNDAEGFGRMPKGSERKDRHILEDSDVQDVKELTNEIRDLQITNKAKDMVIDRMQSERNALLEQVISASRKVGQLEAKLVGLEAAEKN